MHRFPDDSVRHCLLRKIDSTQLIYSNVKYSLFFCVLCHLRVCRHYIYFNRLFTCKLVFVTAYLVLMILSIFVLHPFKECPFNIFSSYLRILLRILALCSLRHTRKHTHTYVFSMVFYGK